MRKREDPGIKLHLNNEEIQSTNSARLLGLQVHKDLTQNYYINEMQDSLMRQVETRFRALKKLCKMTTPEKLKRLGYGLIVSKLAFGICYLANEPEYLLNAVDV